MINPQPVKSYTPPQIPTLEQIKNDSAFLKQMPIRWRKSAAVLAAISVAGAALLAGCSDEPLDDFIPPQDSETTATDDPNYVLYVPTAHELEFRLHSGGSGSAVYIVHFTEAEALGMIRSRLEAAGLRFGAAVPDVVAGDDLWEEAAVTLDLYDEVRDVAIALMTWEQNNINFFRHGDGHQDVQREFEELIDSHVGVFYVEGHFAADTRDEDWNQLPRPSDVEIAAASAVARPVLEAGLNAQIDAFIAILRSAGVV
jgi:hypothetical protein